MAVPDGGEQVARALALMDQFYLSMMESGVLKILAFQYECFAEITEESYLKFLESFSSLSTSIKSLNDQIFSVEHVDAACQTAKIALPNNVPPPQQENAAPTPPPKSISSVKVQKVSIPQEILERRPLKPRHQIIKRDTMVCDYCDNKFTTIENFESHIRQIHGETFSRSLFGCELCNHHFLSLEALCEHSACAHDLKEEADEEGEQLCAYCAELFSSWPDLSTHLVSAHKAHMCQTCHIMCDTEEALNLHVTSTHLTGVRTELLETPPAGPKPVGRPPGSLNKTKQQVAGTAPITPRKRGRPRKVVIPLEDRVELPCTICNLKFATEDALKKHTSNRHETVPKELKCKKCNLTFRRRTAIENHMRIVHNTLDWASDEEEKEEKPSKLELKKALATPAPAVVPPPPVQPESKQSKSAGQIVKESIKKSILGSGLAPVSVPSPRGSRLHCEVCGEVCGRVEDQEIHKDHHATRKRDRFLCLYCASTPMSQHELRTHIVSEHRYRCPFCSLTFWWRANLENHLQQLHATKENCPVCGQYDTGNSLRQHVMQHHTPRKLYLCKLCGTEFTTVREMHDHETLQHAEQTDLGQLLMCDLCQRNFGTRHRLRIHLLRHLHGSFSCHLCGQQCQTQQQLTQHLERHRNSQFACFCGRRFAKKPDLKAHQRSNICKQGTATPELPKSEILVEVSVPKDDIELSAVLASNSPTKLQKLSHTDGAQTNVWQISIALPADESAGAPLSRDFLTALAHSVQEGTMTEGQHMILMGEDGEIVEQTALVDAEQPAEIVQWLQVHPAHADSDTPVTVSADEMEEDTK